MVTLTLFFGITFFILGTICEYLLRIYREVVQRPLYFVAADTVEPNLSANRPAEMLRALA